MDGSTSDTQLDFVSGTLIELRPNLVCRIHLDDGQTIDGIIPRYTARKRSRIVPGDRVRVTVSEGYSLVEFEAPFDEHWLLRWKGGAMDIELLPTPNGNVLACGSYYGGPDYEFVAAGDGQVYFRVVGDTEQLWAGPSAESFHQIASAWLRFRTEVRSLLAEDPLLKAECLKRIIQLKEELKWLGAFPADLPPHPEPLWSLLLFEAENELG